jgi:hypothetical protein
MKRTLLGLLLNSRDVRAGGKNITAQRRRQNSKILHPVRQDFRRYFPKRVCRRPLHELGIVIQCSQQSRDDTNPDQNTRCQDDDDPSPAHDVSISKSSPTQKSFCPGVDKGQLVQSDATLMKFRSYTVKIESNRTK